MDPFWQEIQAAAKQAASDMKVNLDMNLYDTYNTQRMAADIRAAVAASDGSGLLVTIPDDVVSAAVKEAIDAKIPVVGINSGAAAGQDFGVMDFVAPDDVKGGELAAETFVGLKGNITSALYINDQDGNNAYSNRFSGFKNIITGAEMLSVTGEDSSAMEAAIANHLQDCPYQAILLSGPRSLSATIAAYEKSGCSNASLGAFETR